MPVPEDEAERLAGLYSLGILDTPPEESYDAITRTAAYVADAPIALISLVDEQRQWIKSCHGTDLSESARDEAFCAHAILTPQTPLIVEDALADPRFRENPFVVGPPGIRFYCGVPLIADGGRAIGTLCVIDVEPRTIDHDQIEVLRGLADQAVELMRARGAVRALEAQLLLDDEAHVRMLRSVGEILRHSDGLADVLERTLALLVYTLELSAGGLWWRSGDHLATQALWVDRTGGLEGLRHAREGLAYAPEVLIHTPETGTRHAPDVLPTVVSAALAQAGITAVHLVPIHSDGTVIGAFELVSAADGEPRRRQLLAATQVAAEVGRWIERDAAATWIRQATSRDPLTGLMNRRSIPKQVEHSLGGVPADDAPTGGVGLALIELDQFAQISAALTGNELDELVLAIVAAVQEALPPGTRMARHSESALLAILDDVADQRAVAGHAGDIQAALAQPFSADNHRFAVTASIGIAHAPYGSDPHALLANVEQAAADARAAGFGRTAGGVARPAEVRRRLALRTRLESGAERVNLSVVYQPIVRMATRAVAGSEALARWHDPAFGEVLPTEFIPIAEEGPAIRAIGAFVRDRALRDLDALSARAAAPGDHGIWINVSPRELDEQFAATISAELAAAGVAPDRLTLEVTERLALEDDGSSAEALADLAAIGVHIAVDDFGTGFTSLTQLKHLPLSRIKVDRSFTEDLVGPESTRVRPIVSGIVQLAHALGLEVVIEGIATEEQLAVAGDLGADLAQGFLLGMPAPLADPTG
ncbi:MAG: sensor domain-containing phosphodiesterase [Gaiellales bacterium]